MCTCSSPHFLRASSLLRPDEVAVVALVERLVLEHRQFALAQLGQHQIERALRALERRGEGDVEGEPLRLELAAGLARFLDALLGQADVAPAGEQVLQVPVALAVAHEHEKPVGHCILRSPSVPARRSSNKAPASGRAPRAPACSAPRAKIMRSSALCMSSIRSAGPAKITLCSPTTLPPRNAAKPMSPALRAPVWPSRARTECCVELDAAALRRRAAEQQRGAGRRVDLLVVMHFQDFDVERLVERLATRLVSAASKLTPRLILPDLHDHRGLGGVLDLGFVGGRAGRWCR